MGSFDGATAENESTLIRLPFKLMKVEVQFLIKNGYARTVKPAESLSALQRPVPVETFQALTDQRLLKQLEDHRNRKRAELEGLVEKIIAGKRNKGRVVPDREAIIQEEMAKVRKVPCEYALIDYKDPWAESNEYVPYDYPMPSSYLDKLTLKVYEDFCLHRNYYVTCGLKFGGHFLAYPGEPSKHHAEFIIQCEDLGREPTELLLRAHGRLAVGVRKTLLIASLDLFNEKVVYRAGRKYY